MGVPLGDGVHTLKSARGNLYLSVRGGDYYNGGKAELSSNHHSAQAQWVIECPTGTDNKPCTLRNRRSGRYLSVDGASTDDYAEVLQWDNPSSPESQWKIARV